MASQPSPYAAVRRTAASPEPPMTSGIRGSGGGRMRALLREKNCSWWSTASPVASARSTSSVSSSLRPRVAGSTPALISLRSSPPTPTPRISRAAAIWEMVASCLAVTMGCLSPARYTPMSTLRVSLAARIDVADTRPSKPVPPWKLTWSPVVTWSTAGTGDVAKEPPPRRRVGDRHSLTATPSFEVVNTITALPPCPSSLSR